MGEVGEWAVWGGRVGGVGEVGGWAVWGGREGEVGGWALWGGRVGGVGWLGRWVGGADGWAGAWGGWAGDTNIPVAVSMQAVVQRDNYPQAWLIYGLIL